MKRDLHLQRRRAAGDNLLINALRCNACSGVLVGDRADRAFDPNIVDTARLHLEGCSRQRQSTIRSFFVPLLQSAETSADFETFQLSRGFCYGLYFGLDIDGRKYGGSDTTSAFVVHHYDPPLLFGARELHVGFHSSACSRVTRGHARMCTQCHVLLHSGSAAMLALRKRVQRFPSLTNTSAHDNRRRYTSDRNLSDKDVLQRVSARHCLARSVAENRVLRLQAEAEATALTNASVLKGIPEDTAALLTNVLSNAQRPAGGSRYSPKVIQVFLELANLHGPASLLAFGSIFEGTVPSKRTLTRKNSFLKKTVHADELLSCVLSKEALRATMSRYGLDPTAELVVISDSTSIAKVAQLCTSTGQVLGFRATLDSAGGWNFVYPACDVTDLLAQTPLATYVLVVLVQDVEGKMPALPVLVIPHTNAFSAEWYKAWLDLVFADFNISFHISDHDSRYVRLRRLKQFSPILFDGKHGVALLRNLVLRFHQCVTLASAGGAVLAQPILDVIQHLEGSVGGLNLGVVNAKQRMNKEYAEVSVAAPTLRCLLKLRTFYF